MGMGGWFWGRLGGGGLLARFKLIVWQKANELALQVYMATKDFPKNELYGMTSQLRRSAVSIPTNIVEGTGRQGRRELRQFINIALGSLAETEYFMFARGHEILPNNLLQDCLVALQSDPDVVLSYATTMWIDDNGDRVEGRYLPLYDTRGCEVVCRSILIFWGKYEYFYGMTRTETMRSIRPLENIVAHDLIMIFEMALIGTFANINNGIRCRRYRYSTESYSDRIRRYQESYVSGIVVYEKLFPFLRLPLYLFSSVWRSETSLLEKLIIVAVVIINAPLKYLIHRGRGL